MHKLLKDKKVIFFDMGNTLMDFHRGPSDDEKDLIGLENMSKVLESRGIICSSEVLKEKFLDVLYAKFHLRVRDLIEIDVYEILNEFLPLDEELFTDLIYAFYKPYKDHIYVHEGAIDVLKMLKNSDKKIGIISNCFLPAFVYEDIFKFTGLDTYVDEYTFSYTYKLRKPKKELFQAAISKFDEDLSDMVMIGDGFKPDVLGAYDIGMDSIWFNHKGKRPEVCDRLLLTIESLKALL